MSTNTMCVLSLVKCTQADKVQNNTMCVLSLVKYTQADNIQNNTMSVLSLVKCTQVNKFQNNTMCVKISLWRDRSGFHTSVCDNILVKFTLLR